MTRIDWTVTLDTGLPRIDEQHRQLIVLSNNLIRAVAEARAGEDLPEVFEKLLDYTDFHFADEEEYMESVGYPDLEAHRATHRKLINDVGNFREKILGGVPVDPEQALAFINGWIIRHIMVMDSRIGEFVRQRAKG